jgi:ATP-dependent Clp protease ATP-binding subunit ClpX
MKNLKLCCSFCLKHASAVGPLVPGPGSVSICGECIDLFRSALDMEMRRRNPPQPSDPATRLRVTLDSAAIGQDEAKDALVEAAKLRDEGRGRVLLIGPSRASKHFLARTAAHALDVPFAAGDSSGLLKTMLGTENVLPLLFDLLCASDYDVEAAQRGIVYVDGADRPDAQEALFHLWHGQVAAPLGRIPFDIRRVLFVCGGGFAELDEGIARSGRHPQQPVTAELLAAAGASPEWVNQLATIARTTPLDEDTLTRMLAWIDFRRAECQSAGPDAAPGGGSATGNTA